MSVNDVTSFFRSSVWEQGEGENKRVPQVVSYGSLLIGTVETCSVVPLCFLPFPCFR